MEERARSIAKTLSWRIVATSTTVLLVFLLTGNVILGTTVGALEFVAKIVVYYVHERVWNLLEFGRKVR
jgi:uncharacterized membrane protein